MYWKLTRLTCHRLSAYCKRSNHSVPRNRVFSHYATRCGNERVPPLNPASFGKLVRIIFPGITTRRLGVRGESKYHYVELSLTIEDQQEPLNVPRSQSVVVDGHGAQHGLERPRSRRYADICLPTRKRDPLSEYTLSSVEGPRDNCTLHLLSHTSSQPKTNYPCRLCLVSSTRQPTRYTPISSYFTTEYGCVNRASLYEIEQQRHLPNSGTNGYSNA